MKNNLFIYFFIQSLFFIFVLLSTQLSITLSFLSKSVSYPLPYILLIILYSSSSKNVKYFGERRQQQQNKKKTRKKKKIAEYMKNIWKIPKVSVHEKKEKRKFTEDTKKRESEWGKNPKERKSQWIKVNKKIILCKQKNIKQQEFKKSPTK